MDWEHVSGLVGREVRVRLSTEASTPDANGLLLAVDPARLHLALLVAAVRPLPTRP